MKKSHLFAFYCTFLIPAGVLVGIWAARGTGLHIVGILGGTAAGCAISYFLIRSTSSDELP